MKFDKNEIDLLVESLNRLWLENFSIFEKTKNLNPKTFRSKKQLECKLGFLDLKHKNITSLISKIKGG
jgi:23S rRNA maturation mini-RNase III